MYDLRWPLNAQHPSHNSCCTKIFLPAVQVKSTCLLYLVIISNIVCMYEHAALPLKIYQTLNIQYVEYATLMQNLILVWPQCKTESLLLIKLNGNIFFSCHLWINAEGQNSQNNLKKHINSVNWLISKPGLNSSRFQCKTNCSDHILHSWANRQVSEQWTFYSHYFCNLCRFTA